MENVERTERRLVSLEERLLELASRVSTHDAVCLERQKTIFNTLASIQTTVSNIQSHMSSWAVGIIGALATATAALVVLILTRGLK